MAYINVLMAMRESPGFENYQNDLFVVMRESNKRLLLFREVSYTPKNYLPYLRRGDFLPEKTLPILILIFDKGSAQNYVLD